MINAHDLRVMATWVKDNPEAIDDLQADLVGAALSGEDSYIINGVAAQHATPLKLYLESREYDVVVSEPDVNSHSVDMVVSWKVETPPTEESPEDSQAEPCEFEISGEDFLKRFKLSEGWARTPHVAITLDPACKGHNLQSGWTLYAEISDEADVSWINEFIAKHPKYGKVRGDLEKSLYYTSEKALKRFVDAYGSRIEFWDYGDI